MASLLPLAFVGLFGAIGLGLVAVGGARLRKWWMMRKMDPTGAIAVEEGLQEFEGRAHAIDGTHTAPFTGNESLICKHEVERYRHDDDGSNWHTLDSETRIAPFEIEHSGSTVAVDPENAQHLLTDEFEVDTRHADEIPDRVQAYMEQRLDAGDSASIELGPITLGGNRRYRFTEERLDDGEEVYVLGNARRDPSVVPAGSDARLAVNPRDRGWKDRLVGDPFVVSDSGEEEAVSRQLKSGLGMVGIGLLFTAFPVGMAVLMYTG